MWGGEKKMEMQFFFQLTDAIKGNTVLRAEISIHFKIKAISHESRGWIVCA